MLGQTGKLEAGFVKVVTTNHRGLTVDHWAERCLDRIVYVADKSDSVIKEQALAFKDEIRKVLVHYMTQAVKSDRTTLYNLLLTQGEREMAELLRKSL